MLRALADRWWTFALRGALALLFGLGLLAYPVLTLWALIVMFGVYALVDGVGAIILGIGAEKWFLYLLLGVISILAGIVAIARPGATALAILWVIGLWAFVKGVAEIMAAIRIRKEVQGEWALALSGVISAVFGVFVLARPGGGALALYWLIAIYAFAFGILHLMVGFKLRRLKKGMESGSQAA
jgi:uncharacterized membrane protein HdeD (DUF308 family)